MADVQAVAVPSTGLATQAAPATQTIESCPAPDLKSATRCCPALSRCRSTDRRLSNSSLRSATASERRPRLLRVEDKARSRGSGTEGRYPRPDRRRTRAADPTRHGEHELVAQCVVSGTRDGLARSGIRSSPTPFPDASPQSRDAELRGASPPSANAMYEIRAIFRLASECAVTSCAVIGEPLGNVTRL